MTLCWSVPLKLKWAKTMPFWTHRIKKKLGLSPALCNPTKDEDEEEEEEEEEEGEGGRTWSEASQATALRA